MINVAQINNAVIERMSRLQAKNRLAHAYLFIGSQDSGKTQTALALAQMVNCESPTNAPCASCASCVKIASGNHPDVHVIGNDDMESVKIEEIRFLLSRVQLMAYEARCKVFIIRNIELMTMEAANALLKTLEEPTPNTLMILTTSVPEANLDTIKSRCHQVQFFPSPVNRIAKLLSDEGILKQDAQFLAVYSEGCLGKTRKLIEQKLIQRRHKILDELILNRNNDTFLKELSAGPLEAVEALKLLLSFYTDVLLAKSGVPFEQLVNQDYLKEIEIFSKREFDDLARIIQQIVRVRKLVDDKLNIRMALSLLREYIWVN